MLTTDTNEDADLRRDMFSVPGGKCFLLELIPEGVCMNVLLLRAVIDVVIRSPSAPYRINYLAL